MSSIQFAPTPEQVRKYLEAVRPIAETMAGLIGMHAVVTGCSIDGKLTPSVALPPDTQAIIDMGYEHMRQIAKAHGLDSACLG